MSRLVEPAASAQLRDQFEALAAQWKAETALLSATGAMVARPAYQAIIAMGPPALPLILRDLEGEPAHWFEALRAISGEDPVPREHWGLIEAMRRDWLEWGKKRGLI
jgi:hypothetical protein